MGQVIQAQARFKRRTSPDIYAVEVDGCLYSIERWIVDGIAAGSILISEAQSPDLVAQVIAIILAGGVPSET